MSSANTLIVSDIHLGSAITRVGDLHKILNTWKYKRLILLGDIFENLDFSRYTKEHLEFVSFLRQLTQRKEVIWIEGNHDEGINEIIPELLGITVFTEFEWKFNGESYLALHGHQFDKVLTRSVMLTKLAYRFHRFIQAVDLSSKHRLSRYIQKKSTDLCNISDKIAKDAISYACEKGIKYVICGHTHVATSLEYEEVKYFNSGCWTQMPANFLTISNEGIKIHNLQ